LITMFVSLTLLNFPGKQITEQAMGDFAGRGVSIH